MSKNCNRCGKTGLVWKQSNGKWVLADASGYKHICVSQKPRVDYAAAGTPVGRSGYVSDGCGCVEKVSNW